MRLSKRLQAVVDMVPRGSVTADIGCDHGYIPIYLVEEGLCPRVIAMDVNAGPLARAKEHIESVGLSGYIDTRLSDGLEALEAGEAGTAVLAGMGGRLIARILESSGEKTASLRTIVAQPQSEPAVVRRHLKNAGYFITAENMILEDGKYYPVIQAVNGRLCGRKEDVVRALGRSIGYNEIVREAGEAEEWAAVCDEYGELLIRERHPVLREYLQREAEKTASIIGSLKEDGAVLPETDGGGLAASDRGGQRLGVLTARLGRIRDILYWMEKGDSDLW